MNADKEADVPDREPRDTREDRDVFTRFAMSSPDMSRRSLLKWAAAGAGAGALGPMIGRLQAFAAPPVGPRDGILVLIQMSGGNDGLNTLCPVADGRYHDLRGGLAIQPSEALNVGSGLGLHPRLTHIKHMYDQGRVALVRGVGYQPADLSHFTSMGTWMQGWGGAPQSPATGWAGRVVDGFPNADTEGLYAVTIGSSIPPHLTGRVSRASGLPLDIGGAFGIDRRDRSDRRMYDSLATFGSGSTGLGTYGDLVGTTESRLMTLTQQIQPAYQGAMPNGYLAKQLTVCARLINANLGIRVLNTEFGGFDTHTDQAGGHAELMGNLDDGINAFFAALNPAWADRVVLMTFSEFGRRPEASDGGTDHGTASVMFVVGSRVKGGLHGSQPSLASSGLDPYGNLVPNLDFRSVYASIVDKWFGADDREVLGKAYPQLDLFRAGPGTAVPRATPSTSGNGYWIATAAGAIASKGHAPAENALRALARPIVGGDSTRSQRGFWLVASDGGIFSYGDAGFHGSTGAIHLNQAIVGMAGTRTGRGYWLVASDGGIFCFGDAGFHGSTGAIHLNKAIVGMAATPTGRGYWLVASDGGIFCFGDAGFHGSTGAMRLNRAIVGMAATPTGRGYWLVASDGGVFCFGDAGFHGSAGGGGLPAPARALRRTSSGKGYWILGSDGTVKAFGDAGNYGSARAPMAVALLPAHS